MRIASTLVLTAASVGFSTAAFAHAHLKSASPAVNSTVQAVPKQVSLGFTEGLEPLFSTIEVDDQNGARVDSGTPSLAPDDNKQFTVPVKPLQPGVYTVVWHATSVDTHKTEGKFQFTVAP